MIKQDFIGKSALAVAVVMASAVAACAGQGRERPPATTPSTQTATGGAQAVNAISPETVDVLLCDGKTKVSVASGTPGTAIAGQLMAEWMRKNPSSNWEAEERERHTLLPAADNTALIGQVDGQTYGRITAQDVAQWKTETERVATAGSAVFHNADQLGSTVGVSCDMCHPHAANTHPETYPKFQAQLGRVALLRDMINWCIEHPVRGKALAADDPRMRSLESYILAQRKGRVLEYGKH
jgi:thiosulfate dehydrogenase